jgi:hypothetical protein
MDYYTEEIDDVIRLAEHLLRITSEELSKPPELRLLSSFRKSIRLLRSQFPQTELEVEFYYSIVEVFDERMAQVLSRSPSWEATDLLLRDLRKRVSNSLASLNQLKQGNEQSD